MSLTNLKADIDGADINSIGTGTDTDTTPNAPKLADFQRQFGQYLRHQKSADSSTDSLVHNPSSSHSNRDASDKTQIDHGDNDCDSHSDHSTNAILQRISQDIPSRVGKLYQSLIFNNVCSFLNQCFPVCQSLISEEHWLDICQAFFLQHACHSPYFTEINQSFVDFLAQPEQLQQLNLPPYFAELAHYEWVELMVDTHTDSHISNNVNNQVNDLTNNHINSQTNLADESAQLALNPSLQNLHYQWPVHSISREEQPENAEDSFFLVFRNDADEVEFMQVNAMTHALLAFIDSKPPIQTQPATLTDELIALLNEFAQLVGHDSAVLVEFGLPLLVQLSEQGVLQYRDTY